jgi:hypothetical protein
MNQKLRFLCSLLLEEGTWRAWRPFGVAQDMLGAITFFTNYKLLETNSRTSECKNLDHFTTVRPSRGGVESRCLAM